MGIVIQVDFRKDKVIPVTERVEEYSLQEIAHFTTNWEYPYEIQSGMTGLFEGGVNVGVNWTPGDIDG